MLIERILYRIRGLKPMKAMLLRVGVDKGTDNALAPIFQDGSFEYIPISEGCLTNETKTFKNTIGRKGRTLYSYLPRSVENRIMHFDPEFETFTYGDPTSKKTYLLKLDRGDLLVFYAGLIPYKNNNYYSGLYIIGYFTVERVIDFAQLSDHEIDKCYQLYPNNAHLKRNYVEFELALVVGSKDKSMLLERGILISKTKCDVLGRPYYAVSDEMEDLLGIKGSIQRSVPPRFIKGDEKTKNLKDILGF